MPVVAKSDGVLQTKAILPPQVEVPGRMPVLILAGGQGDGLFPLTLSRPKPAIALGPCRLIDFTLANCRRSGLKDCALLTQYRRDQVAAHIRKCWNRGFRCVPPVPAKRYRGTADAVYQNITALANAEHVLILAGDHVYGMDYRKLIRRHIESGANLTISTIRSPLAQAMNLGVVEVDDAMRVVRFEEKPSAPRPVPGHPDTARVSMGVYVFKVRALVEALRHFCDAGTGFDFGYHIIPAMVLAGNVFADDFCNEVTGAPSYWRDIGTIDSYYDASMDLLRPTADFNPYRENLPSNVGPQPVLSFRGDRTHIEGTMICDGVQLANDVEIEDSVLLPNVIVGQGARLRRVIVDEGIQIPAGFSAGWDLEADRANHIVSLGGVVVVSHAPSLSGRFRRERTLIPQRRPSTAPSTSSNPARPRPGGA
jgi:glucose-1-phosphate adenylyltransferase